MSSYARKLRQRGQVAASYEATTVAGGQRDDEAEYDHAALERFMEHAGISDEDRAREQSSVDGAWFEFDVPSTSLSVSKALQAGASSAWTVNHPSNAAETLTRVRIGKSWSLMRNFGKPFQIVVGVAGVVLLCALGYTGYTLFRYDNATEIAKATLKSGLGLD